MGVSWNSIRQRLSRAGGDTEDYFLQSRVLRTVLRALIQAEIEGGFDHAEREDLLAQLPAVDGSSLAAVDASRRLFQTTFVPLLLDPQKNLEIVMKGLSLNPDHRSSGEIVPFGNFDPLKTAKIFGKLYDAQTIDLLHPSWQAKRADVAITDAAKRKFPLDIDGPLASLSSLQGRSNRDWFSRLAVAYVRGAFDAGENSLGYGLVVIGQFPAEDIVRRTATLQNLTRAVLLLRMNRPLDVADPVDGKPLRFDPKAKMVWSIGDDGIDQGGDIGKRGKDYGFFYSGQVRGSNPENLPYFKDPNRD